MDMKITTLNEVIQFKNGKKRPATEGNFPVYGGNGILGYADNSNYENCIIIGRVGAYCGSVYLEDSRCWVSDNAIAALPVGDNDTRFLYYLLKGLHLNERHIGTSQPLLTQEILNKIECSIPTPSEQRKIAALLGCLDDKISSNQQINDNLYAQAKAIFANRFINLASVPDGWRTGNLLDIANYLNGLAMQKFRPLEDEIGLPVLKIKELRQGSCDSSSELCSPNIKSEYIVHDGDVIFSWSGSLLVDIWCGGTCGLNQHLFKVISDVYDKWFYYLWTAHHLDRFIAIAADKATTMGHIKREELSKAEVLIPSEESYMEISSIMQPIFELMISNRIEARKLAALRDELLPKLMSGEIDVSEVSL
jgi:type I restriction enzyme S subunit